MSFVFATRMKRRHSTSKMTPARVGALGSFGSAKRQKLNIVVANNRRDNRAKRALALGKQIRALVASKKRDAADVNYTNVLLGGTTVGICLTSSTTSATAASGTGLLDCDADEVLVNTVRLRGQFQNGAILDLDPTANYDSLARIMVVCFNKPLLVASAAGTLPPITEVLVADSMVSLPVTAAANGGRFSILYDKTINLGNNTFQAVTAVGHSRNTGPNVHNFDFFVKIAKQVKFVAPSQSGTTAGGHYDSDVDAGRVDKNLLVMYILTNSQGAIGINVNRRLNYTG